MKRSASINFEFVRHSGASIGNVVFSLVRFVGRSVDSRLELGDRKKFIPKWLKYDPKLIGVICYSASSPTLSGERKALSMVAAPLIINLCRKNCLEINSGAV